MNDSSKKRRKESRRQRIEGLLRGRPNLGPQTVHFDIANACNTRCTTCWHHSPYLKRSQQPSALWKKQMMDLATFRGLFDDLLALGGLEQIILSGMGDPTLNPALYEMVAHAHAHGIGVTIITNLLRVDVARLLASPGELELLTSICGVTERVWQDFHAHPRPHGFETLTAQLGRLAEAEFRPKYVQVINGQNVHELVEMVRFAARYPVKRINFKLASLAHGTEVVALSDAQKTHLSEVLIPAARAEADALQVDTDLDAFALQVQPGSHQTAPIADIGCFMGYVYARITVDLELLYCCNTQVSVGQITAATPLSFLWSGPRYASLRAAQRRGVYFRGCDQCGKFKQNLKWHQRLAETLPTQVFRGLYGSS